MNQSHQVLRWAPWVSWGVFSVLWVRQWAGFPFVLDPYYHLLVAQQVVAAHGPLAYEWWEYAPIGRPHLYPPVLHLLLATLLQLGAAPLAAIRLATAVLVPGLLLSLYLVARRLVTPSAALVCLWAAIVPAAFHLHGGVALASTVGLIELLWLLEALESRRWLAAGLWLTLLCYTHLGLPWIALASVGAYAWLRPVVRREVARTALGLLPAIPWLWHVLSHRAAISSVRPYENLVVDVMPGLLAAGALGAWVCWRLRQRYLLLIACGLGFGLLAFHYRFRWLSGEGLLPVILLAGVGVHWLAQRVSRAAEGSGRHLLVSGGLVVLLCLSPTIVRQGTAWQVWWPDSGPVRLLSPSELRPRQLGARFAVRLSEQAARVVSLATSPGEILWSNASYMAGLVAALAGRPTSSAMLSEVGASALGSQVSAAQVIVWFKFDPQPGDVRIADLAPLPLTTLFEDEFLAVYRRRDVLPVARAPRAAVPYRLALALLVIAVAVAVCDRRLQPARAFRERA